MSFQLGYVFAFVLIVVLAVYGKAVLRVLSVRLRAVPEYDLVERRDVPADVMALLEGQAGPVEALGFEPFAFARASADLDGVEQPTWSSILCHPREKSFAVLAMSGAPTRTRPCDLSFHAVGDRERTVETLDFAILPAPSDADHVLIDAQTPVVADHWARHQKEVAAHLGNTARELSREELREACLQERRLALERSIAAGQFVRTDAGSLRFTFRHAIAAVIRSTSRDASKRTAIGKQQKALRAKGALPGAAASAAAPPDVTAEVWAHQRRHGAEGSRRRAGWVMKLGLFVVSVVAFAIAFGIQLSFDRVVMIFAVLLVHELGHALAMKAFGYRDMQILFIPFLGAVAAGKSHSPKPWQELIVLLAGPVPGIVAGTYLLTLGSPDWPAWVPDLAWLMLIVNYMNLLPILPLDGGRIMSLALFDRFPKLQLAFSGLSGFALGVAGRYFDDPILFGLGIAMLVALPQQLKQTRVLDGARKRLAQLAPTREPADPVPALYTELQDPRFDSYNSETKYQLVVALAERLGRRPAGAGLAVLSIVGWIVCMLLPVGMVSYQAVTSMAEYEAQHAIMVAEAEARIDAADTPEEELRARIDAAQFHYVAGGLEDARRHIEPARALSASVGQPELELSVLLLCTQIEISFGDHLLADGTLKPSTGDALRRALELSEQRFGATSLEVADVLEAYPPGALGDPVAAIVRQLRLIDIYERAMSTHPERRWQLFTAHHNEALLRASYQDFGRAETALLRALDVAAAISKEDGGLPMQLNALEELTHFYFGRHRWDEVPPLLERRAALSLARKEMSEEENDLEDGDEEAFEGLPGSLEMDRCWLAYWRGDSGAGRCFAALKDSVSKSTIAELAGPGMSMGYLVDQVTATRRAGDDASALQVLSGPASDAGFRESLDTYVSLLDESEKPNDSASFAMREEERRNAERARLVGPLLTQLASATP